MPTDQSFASDPGPEGGAGNASDPTYTTEQFLACFTKEQRSIYVMIRSMLFDPTDADEVFQETSLALWKDFAKYTPGSDFGAWARQVARYRVLAHSKRRKADRLQFSSELVEKLVAQGSETDETVMAMRHDALSGCLHKLPANDRQLLEARYARSQSVADFAGSERGAASASYKRLVRIRRNLVQCIERQLRESG